MKNSLGSIFLLLLCANLGIHAQQPVLRLRSGPLELERVGPARAATFFGEGPANDRTIKVLQFDHTLTGLERQALTARGAIFLSPIRPHAWIVSVPRIDASQFFELGLVAAADLRPKDKVDPRIVNDIHDPTLGEMLVLVAPWPYRQEGFLEHVRGMLANVTSWDDHGILRVTASPGGLQQLLAQQAVQWIEPVPEPGRPEDLRGRSFHRVNTLGPVLPDGTGLDGEGVTVVVNDDGFVGPHVDLKGRTEQSGVAGDLVGDHGDMVAGIVGGAGNIDPRATGMAPASTIIVRQYQGQLPNTLELHADAGAVIFNSSYSNGCNAGYTTTTQRVDEEIHLNSSLIQVFSAGNDGELDCDYGAGPGWGNITGGHKTGKNVIATANLMDNDALVSSSSRGPTADGRIKPDISAMGNGQMSMASNYGYMSGSGTSAASPGIAGVLALLYQGWYQQYAIDPSSALLKAFLLNTADDLGTTGPDYRFGWGAVNAARAYTAMSEGRWTTISMDASAVEQITLTVPENTAELRVMAYWNDPAGPLLAINALVNDIDLIAADPLGGTHRPWSLSIDPEPAALGAAAIKDEDHLNNVEQVHVVDPVPGTWSFSISGSDVPMAPQEVFIVYEFVPRGIAITWPGNNERLASDQSHRFRWDTSDRNTPVTIGYSINGGASWTDISVPGTQRFHDLTFGSVVLNDFRFRVVQGAMADERTGITVMRTPNQLGVTVNCVDSAFLDWPDVPDAQQYIVHRLGARYMESVDTIPGSSYWFTGLQAVHDDWFAVTAIGTGGEVGARSLAVRRPQQLVGCVASQDLTVLQVLAPAGPIVPCQPQPDLTLQVRNAGSIAVNGFDIGMRNAAGVLFSTTINATLPAGDTTIVTLPGAMLALPLGTTSTLQAWSAAPMELYPLNDTIAFTLTAHDVEMQYPYFNDMEGYVNCSAIAVCDQVCPIGSGLLNGINGLEDQMDWRVDSAGTPSGGMGPSVDHTFGTAFGRYLYMEATGACFNGEAHLLTPCFTVPGSGAIGVAYHYHMLGDGIGSLHVDLLVDGLWVLDALPPVEGGQGDYWIPGFVDLAPYAGSVVNVRFRGVRGTSALSDIALDDIHIDASVGIEEGPMPLIMSVRQTATPGQFVLQLPGTEMGSLGVLDMLGRIVLLRAQAPGHAIVLDLSQFASGPYTLVWTTPHLRSTARVVRR